MSLVAQFTERLRSNLASAEAEYARVEANVLARRARGEDTSKVTPPSAHSSDFTLAKLEGRVEHARKALADYLAQTGQEPTP